jgi:hypothetical protein
MAGKRDAPCTAEMSVRVRMGVPALEAGYTLIPNLLLDHYETLGLTDGTALFVIRLLRQSAGGHETLPDSPQVQEHLHALQDRGLLFVRRWPDGVELCLDVLFHNLARLATWLAEGGSPDDFELQVPADVLAGVGCVTDRLGSADFEAEVADVLAAFAAANRRPASPAEKEQIRNLAVRFDAAARTTEKAANGPAWVMAALRSALDRKEPGSISAPDLERILEGQADAARSGAAEPVAPGVKAIRREVTARIRRMGPQEKEALETVIMAYRGISGQPPDDRLILTLMRLADEYGSTWVLNAIHETGKVQRLISPEYVESILLRWRSEGHIPGAPKTAESLPITDPLLTRVVALYEQEVGQLTVQVQAQLLALTEEFRDVDDWQRAFAEAARSNARNLRYVEAVLRGKGKKPAPATRRSTGRRRKGAERAGVWTEEELDAARREALSEAPIDVEEFLSEEA